MVTRSELHQHRRDVKIALEMAIAARAPWEIVDQLAATSGLLEALVEVPDHVLIPAVVQRTRASLESWLRWQEQWRVPAA